MSQDDRKGHRPPDSIEDDTIKNDPEDTNVARAPRQGDLVLPHERDESPQDGGAPREIIEQAARDVARGLRDTERRGIPSDVPSPEPRPENTPGAKVPRGGVARTKYGKRRKKSAGATG